MVGIEAAFTGRLGRPTELRNSKNGKSYSTFSLAVSTGEDAATWVSVVAFGETAKAIAGMPAGTSVYVEGKLHLDNYEKRDGTTVTQLKVVASLAMPLGQIGQRRRPSPPRKPVKLVEPPPSDSTVHDGPNDPLPF